MEIRRFKGKSNAAICISIDDVCPLKLPYGDFGGELANGRLGKLLWLADRHRGLKFTLFTTADWREISPLPTRKIAAKIPWLRDRIYLAKRYPKGKFSLASNPDFVDFINDTPAFEVAFHGLTHCHKGKIIPVEFQDETRPQISKTLKEMLRIFEESGIKFVRGFCPPAWNAPQPLREALADIGVRFLASARDLRTPISKNAKTDMSGMKGIPLIFPAEIDGGKMVHFPVNFQATSRIERAVEIIKNGGLLSIKCHISDGMIDIVNDVYVNYLDALLSRLEDEFGDGFIYTTMGEMTDRIYSENEN